MGWCRIDYVVNEVVRQASDRSKRNPLAAANDNVRGRSAGGGKQTGPWPAAPADEREEKRSRIRIEGGSIRAAE